MVTKNMAENKKENEKLRKSKAIQTAGKLRDKFEKEDYGIWAEEQPKIKENEIEKLKDKLKIFEKKRENKLCLSEDEIQEEIWLKGNIYGFNQGSLSKGKEVIEIIDDMGILSKFQKEQLKNRIKKQ